MVGITGDTEIIDFGRFDTLQGRCRVSGRSRALRSGQLGLSEWRGQ